MPVPSSKDPVILQVTDLSVAFRRKSSQQYDEVLSGISFQLHCGEVLGLLGESGCGKSTLALSLLRLLPESARMNAGALRFGDRDLLALNSGSVRQLRGAKISIIFQDPALALNPLLTAGSHVTEVIRAHEKLGRKQTEERALGLLHEMGLAQPERVFRSYPHELSGGEAQRILIAQALACDPELVIADEPTASLDAVTQAEIIRLLSRLVKKRKLSMLFVTHNPALLLGFADRVLVMDSGRIVETGNTLEVLREPKAAFTRAIVAAMEARTAARAM